MEPTTDRKRGEKSGRRFHNHASERLRILGEIPLRKFARRRAAARPRRQSRHQLPRQDSRPIRRSRSRRSTSDGLVLNMAQTWHQLRPGEIRNDCGGCHAHSQKPTDFELTAAAKPDYKVWDLIERRRRSSTDQGAATQSQDSKWDADERRPACALSKHGPLNVEYHRDIKPILAAKLRRLPHRQGRQGAGRQPRPRRRRRAGPGRAPRQVPRHLLPPGDGRAGQVRPQAGRLRLAGATRNASRYIRKFQSRRSLLVWKIYGKRLDGFCERRSSVRIEAGRRRRCPRGEEVDAEQNAPRMDLDFVGSQMPPPDAVDRPARSQPLTDEDRRTIAPLDRPRLPDRPRLRPEASRRRGYGWMLDDNRPVLTLTLPQEHQPNRSTAS